MSGNSDRERERREKRRRRRRRGRQLRREWYVRQFLRESMLVVLMADGSPEHGFMPVCVWYPPEKRDMVIAFVNEEQVPKVWMEDILRANPPDVRGHTVYCADDDWDEQGKYVGDVTSLGVVAPFLATVKLAVCEGWMTEGEDFLITDGSPFKNAEVSRLDGPGCHAKFLDVAEWRRHRGEDAGSGPSEN
jgi:hypothetical protein